MYRSFSLRARFGAPPIVYRRCAYGPIESDASTRPGRARHGRDPAPPRLDREPRSAARRRQRRRCGDLRRGDARRRAAAHDGHRRRCVLAGASRRRRAPRRDRRQRSLRCGRRSRALRRRGGDPAARSPGGAHGAGRRRELGHCASTLGPASANAASRARDRVRPERRAGERGPREMDRRARFGAARRSRVIVAVPRRGRPGRRRQPPRATGTRGHARSHRKPRTQALLRDDSRVDRALPRRGWRHAPHRRFRCLPRARGRADFGALSRLRGVAGPPRRRRGSPVS